MPDPTLVVMAAGIGSRFGGLKQVVPVGPNGALTLSYAVYDALEAGFTKVVFVITGEIESEFRERIGRAVEQRVDTHYVFQRVDQLPAGCSVPPGRTRPWGTAHAVLCCQDVVNEPFAAINADDFYGRSTFVSMAEYLRSAHDRPGEYDYCTAGFILKNTLSPHGHVARGICTVSADNCLIDVVERRRVRRFGDAVKYTVGDEQWIEIPADTIVSMNMWGFTPSIFGELDTRFARFLDAHGDDPLLEFFIPSVVADLVKESRARVRVLPTHELWLGVTYKDDVGGFHQAVREMTDRGIYPESLWE